MSANKLVHATELNTEHTIENHHQLEHTSYKINFNVQADKQYLTKELIYISYVCK
jgi:hypothetical protein